MFDVPLLTVPYEDWYCPNGCYAADRHAPLPPGATRYHPCSRLHGLNAPLERAGTDCKVEAVEREDYLGEETQAMGDDGRAYMAIRTVHADGSVALAVNAGLAHGEMRV